jgi:acetyl-CoA carboxylase biotin carboxyl carrier protein
MTTDQATDQPITDEPASAVPTTGETVAGPPATAGSVANGHQTIARLADELLPVLIARLGASGLGELEVRQDDWRVRIRQAVDGKGESEAAPMGHPSAVKAVRGSSAARPESRSDKATGGEQPADITGRRERGRVAITSPGVGYYQPRDGLIVGESVRGGDLLGHVDVLGVRHDVVAPQTGILAALTAQPGEAVEYGQPLARLDPEGRA